MSFVAEINRWIPFSKLERAFLVLLEEYRTRPIPLSHEEEKFENDVRCSSFRIQLADPSDHHSIGNATWIPHNVSIKGALFSPELDRAKGHAEDFRLGYKVEDSASDSGAVHTAQIGIIKPTKQIQIRELLRPGNGGKLKTAEDEIDRDSTKFELDDRYADAWDWGELRNILCFELFPQEIRHMFEEVLSGYMFWREHERVHVRLWSIDTQLKAAECEDLAASLVQNALW
jgi:hypothetical protein